MPRCRIAIFFLFVLLLAIPASMAGSATVTIYGTNASNAQQNVTNTGNQNINVTAWNVGGIKTFYVRVTNASDTLIFNLYNVTVGQINEFKINGTAINGYQANSNGLVTFIRTQTTGNSTFNLQPAINVGGNNVTWSWFKDVVIENGTAAGFTITSGTSINVTTFNATTIVGDGSGISNLNLNNVTNLPATLDAMNTSSHANRTWAQSLFDWLNGTALPAKADAVYTNTTLNEKVNKSGDTMTGALIVSWLNDTSGNAYVKNTTILNTSTVTVGRNSNGTVELSSLSLKTVTTVYENYTVLPSDDIILVNFTRDKFYDTYSLGTQSGTYVPVQNYTVNTSGTINISANVDVYIGGAMGGYSINNGTIIDGGGSGGGVIVWEVAYVPVNKSAFITWWIKRTSGAWTATSSKQAANTSSGTINITLPAPSNGKEYVIKNIANFNVSMWVNSTSLIDNASSVNITTPWSRVSVISDSSQYWIYG